MKVYSFTILICVLVTLFVSGCTTEPATPVAMPSPDNLTQTLRTATPDREAMQTPSSPGTAHRNVLLLTLSLDKQAYHAEEPVYALLTIQNIGTESVLVKTRMVPYSIDGPPELRDVSFEIADSSGYIAPYIVFFDPVILSPDDFIILTPGNTCCETRLDIGTFYGFNRPDTYSVRAFYENRYDPADTFMANASDNRVAWKGVLLSNVVTFTLEP